MKKVSRRCLLILCICSLLTAGPFQQINLREVQGEPVDQDDMEPEMDRDPFIPLIDGQGNARTFFHKPRIESLTLKVTLMGISNINNENYALIDGELVKRGDKFKEFTVDEVYPDKIILKLGEKVFEVKWEADKDETK